MSDKYSHRERIQKIMAGEKPDRFAASNWRHFYHKESTAEGLAEAMLDFQKRFDWDFMKINPRASYHAEDWGNKYSWSKDEFKKHERIQFPVETADDWAKIDVLPAGTPVLTDHLKAIELIKKASDPELPLVMTVFNPLGIARYLAGGIQKMLDYMNNEPDKVHAALENITVTFERYVTEIRNAGADGIFYATLEWGSADLLTYEQYEKFSRQYDSRILKASGDDSLNIMHVCGSNNILRQLADYPVELFNWDACDPTNVNIDRCFEYLGDKTVIGGLDHKGWLWHSTPEEVATEVGKIKERMAGKKFIFGPGCSIDAHIPFANLDAVRRNL
jgi:uroporphyrinogen decarboxylase